MHDCLAAVARNRPNALIVDFFAGAGTTLHAAALLNASDGGGRRCIEVTNNEVDHKTARRLNKSGLFPGDPDFERHGIFHHVIRPRTEAILTGRRPDGRPIPGHDKTGRPFADGVQENVAFFKLNYLDPDAVEFGAELAAVLPLLWLAAGAAGPCPQVPDDTSPWLILEAAHLAILLTEARFADFQQAVLSTPALSHVFLVTDSAEAFGEMRTALPRTLRVSMLYRDYLRSFRVNMESRS